VPLRRYCPYAFDVGRQRNDRGPLDVFHRFRNSPA
jgi:hypothetical protein